MPFVHMPMHLQDFPRRVICVHREKRCRFPALHAQQIPPAASFNHLPSNLNPQVDNHEAKLGLGVQVVGAAALIS